MYNRTLHILAVLTTLATFPLIFMGGLVTSHGAGMSVPDWPNSYGYNMFTFPPSMWIGGIFYEHTHRLMGTVVGMLAIALTVYAWRAEIAYVFGRVLAAVSRGRAGGWQLERRHSSGIRWVCLGVLATVIMQGVLGGLRVVLVQVDLAIVHACFAQAFFCLAAYAALVTSKWWTEAPDLSQSEAVFSGRRLIVACVIALIAIYAQLIVGAAMRHYQAGLAVPDFPLAYGEVIPTAATHAGIHEINDHRAWNLHLPPVTVGQVWLHMGHRMGAVIVSLAVIAAVVLVLRSHRGESALIRPALLLSGLLVTQVTLGALTVLWRKPADVASAHVAVGALTLVTTFVLTFRAARLYARRREEVGFEADETDRDGYGAVGFAAAA
jgi:heme a synthase